MAIKVNTVEQFKILKHIFVNFKAQEITIDILDENGLMMVDKLGGVAIFRLINGEIVLSDK